MIKGNLKETVSPQNVIGKTAQTVAAKPIGVTNADYNATLKDRASDEPNVVGIANTVTSSPNDAGLRIGSAVERRGNTFPSASGAGGVVIGIGTTKIAKP